MAVENNVNMVQMKRRKKKTYWLSLGMGAFFSSSQQLLNLRAPENCRAGKLIWLQNHHGECLYGKSLGMYKHEEDQDRPTIPV